VSSEQPASNPSIANVSIEPPESPSTPASVGGFTSNGRLTDSLHEGLAIVAALGGRLRFIPLLALAACHGDDAPVTHTIACDAVVAPASPVVVRVTWETPEEGTSWVDYSTASGEFATPEQSAGKSHQHELLGLHPLEDVAYTAHTVGVSGDDYVCDGTITTNNLPPGAPFIAVSVDVPEKQASFRYLMGAAMNQTESTIFVIDRAGHYVWHAQKTEDDTNARPIGKFVADGSILSLEFPDAFGIDQSELVWRDLEANVTARVPIPYGHHLFGEAPDGAYGWIKADTRDYFDPTTGLTQPTYGDAVHELAADGTDRELWNAWDWMDPPPDLDENIVYYPDSWDWTHGNCLFHLADDDAWLFSMANARTVVEVDRGTGATVRSFHGGPSEMKDGSGLGVVEGNAFRHQHDVHVLDDGHLMMFATRDDKTATGAFEYAIEDDGLHQVWSYEAPLASWALGQANRLDNGNTLVTFSASGVVREVTPDGEVVWEIDTEAFTWFGQVYPMNDLWTGH
jgi:hypothetical protein